MKRQFLALSALLALPLAGCQHEESISVKCGGGNPCSVEGTIKFTHRAKTGATPAQLVGAPDSGYTVLFHVPDSELTLATNNITQATLTATTDTGYSSAITVDLTPTGSNPSTLVSGDRAYSFVLPPSTALTDWVNTVNNNTMFTNVIDAESGVTFSLSGQEGTYIVYAQVLSTQTGTQPPSSVVFTDPGSGRESHCQPGRPCTQ